MCICEGTRIKHVTRRTVHVLHKLHLMLTCIPGQYWYNTADICQTTIKFVHTCAYTQRTSTKLLPYMYQKQIYLPDCISMSY